MNTVILTSYFSKKKHPNAEWDNHVVGRGEDGKVFNNEFNYIKGWYNSVNNLNVKGVIFHDDLSEDFVESYQNDKISFVKVNEDFLYSNNDYRFFCFYDYLLQNKFDCVFHADVSDVIVVQNPSELLTEDFSFFACKDSIMLNQFPYKDFHFNYDLPDQAKLLDKEGDWDLINMGVVGGNYENMLLFYRTFCAVRNFIKPAEVNLNMWLCQYLLRFAFSDKKTQIGYPVCSEFKKYQKDRKDVYFIHK